MTHPFKSLLVPCLCATVLALATAPVAATPKTIELPPDGMQLKPSSLPGYAKAQAQCVACHSAEYMAYQPLTAPRGYWDAMVHRMKAVFKAPINDADMPEIVDYLVKTYGNEQPK
ncbi:MULTISPECIES: cytochrome c, class I [Ramlibacter]|uniref:Cytochrome c, class I n=1 Tax=Ramlibacter aquaticus TaxID=2780094 RepID=A0ABR9SH59_9BURK|nr:MULTISPECIES: cytochrome c, class I [Ramlibacter]MBE7941685.1 cytochrome c, class I [Ramlibacter aquaticus]